MKKILIIAFAGVLAGATAYGGESLEMQYSTISDGYHNTVWGPMHKITYKFAEEVSVKPNAEALLMDKDGVIASYAILSDNSTDGGTSMLESTSDGLNVYYKYVYVELDGLQLSVGEDYTLVVPEGCIMSANNPNVSNEAIADTFSVPSTLGVGKWTLEDVVVQDMWVGFCFPTEIELVGSPEIMLYRDGELMLTSPCKVSNDWDLGNAFMAFDGWMKFDDGVKYKLVLPENSVCAVDNHEVVNEQSVVEFIGGYVEPERTIWPVWDNFDEVLYTNEFDVMIFKYAEPIHLGADPKAQLWGLNGAKLIKEVVPTLDKEDGAWVVKADFEHTAFDPSLCPVWIEFAQGSIMSGDFEDVDSEPLYLAMSTATSGVAAMQAIAPVVRVVGGTLAISGLERGTHVNVYAVDGRLVARTEAHASEVMCDLRRGVYIVEVNNRTVKVAVR